MEHLTFTEQIAAPKNKVWDIMLAPDTYKQWVSVSWPGSTYNGKWKLGEKIRFESPGQGGTLAQLDEYKPHDTLLATHIAVLNPDGSEDRASDVAKGWIGSTERYTFTEQNGKTTLQVDIETNPAWADMFKDGWPNALKELKKICEAKPETVGA